MKANIQIITPAQATKWLEQNVNNRPIREAKVAQFIRAMERGEWVMNGESIKRNGNGDLLDGQHRLWACALSGVSFESLVVDGLSTDVQATVDQGTKRTLGDTLRWRGESNGTTLGSMLRVIKRFYDTGEVATQGYKDSYTKGELIELLDTVEPDLRESLAYPERDPVGSLLTRTVAGSLFHLFRQTDEDDAVMFFELLGTGASLGDGNPILLLRNALIASKQRTHSKMDTRHRAALTIKAYNFWRRGELINRLLWRAGGAKAEHFPRIEGFDYSFLDKREP